MDRRARFITYPRVKRQNLRAGSSSCRSPSPSLDTLDGFRVSAASSGLPCGLSWVAGFEAGAAIAGAD